MMSNPREEFEKINKVIEESGGQKRIQKQHDSNKLTARERIERLFDKDTFEEIDKFVEHRSNYFGLDEKSFPADGVITGVGKINGKQVAVFSQDFTVQGGSLGEMHAKKIMKIQDLAMKLGIPIIGINDSGGARIQEGVDALYGYGGIFFRNTRASGVIPQITIIDGPCAGGAVYSPAITDFIIMVDEVSQMFITGPQVIKTVTGEDIDKESLGGASVHNSKSGVAHFKAKSDEDALNIAKNLLKYIPQNNLDGMDNTSQGEKLKNVEGLKSIIPDNPRTPYSIKDLILLIADSGEFLEVHSHYAKNIITGFCKIGGFPVGIVANQPNYLAGVLDIDCSDKAARFIRFLDAFNIPIITFVDTPGFLPGIAQEHGGIIRHGAKLLYAYSESTVPKVTVILRKAYGGAYIAMGSKHLGADVVYAWPNAEIAVMGPEGAANIIFRKEISSSDNPEKTRKDKIGEYKDLFANPYRAAARGYIDSVILPEETRKKIIRSLEILESKVEAFPNKKHGNIPL